MTVDFEEHRKHLRGVAFRMLGSLAEADDAVQEAWLRLQRAEPGIDNPRGWLTTVVARVCLDVLRGRKHRGDEPPIEAAGGADPEQETLMAESVGLALLVVLDALAPAERLAFVLHDLFALPFEDIAGVLGKTSEATRQLASRARRRVQGAATASREQLEAQREVVKAFLAALRSGDLQALLAVLHPDVVVRNELGTLRGRVAAETTMKTSRGARFAAPALVDGWPGLVVAPSGKLVRAIRFRVEDGLVVEAESVIGEALAGVEIATLD